MVFVADCKNNGNKGTTAAKIPLEQIAVYSTRVPEPSGLTYYKKHNTLLTVSDKNSTVYEIDFEGKVINTIKTKSSDLEGIAVSADNDTFYVASEYSQSIDKYLFDGTKLSSLYVGVAEHINNSLEGVTIDNNNNLYIINEKKPRLLLKYCNGVELFRKKINAVNDLSDIFYEKENNCLWILSDESAKILKLTTEGNLLAEYSIPFTKGEGITLYKDRIYIINDHNQKLYVFKKP